MTTPELEDRLNKVEGKVARLESSASRDVLAIYTALGVALALLAYHLGIVGGVGMTP